MNSIPKNLKEIRTSKGWTQQQMADALFITRQAVSNWETGKNMPDLQTLQNMAQPLGITVEEILYGKQSIATQVKKDYSKIKKQIIIAVVMYAISLPMMMYTFICDLNVDFFLVGACIYIAGARPVMAFTVGNYTFQYLKYNDKINVKLPFAKIIRYIVIAICCFQFIAMLFYSLTPIFYYFGGVDIIPAGLAGVFTAWLTFMIKGFAFLGLLLFFSVGFVYEWSVLKD